MAHSRKRTIKHPGLITNTFIRDCSAPVAKPRIIIAQDLGDKAKVVLYDSAAPANETPGERSHRAAGAHAHASEKHNERKSQVMTELMFGTIPLSYRGTSVRVHPLQDRDHDGTRTFLFTKVFSVDVIADEDELGVGPPTGGTSSLSSSWSSTSGMREYPFPTMTPLNGHVDKHAQPGSRNSSRDRMHQRHHQRTTSLTNPQQKQMHARRPESSTSVSGGLHAMRGPGSLQKEHNAAFTGTQSHDAEEQATLGWLPSPGPYLSQRRRSIDTTGSNSPTTSWCGSQTSSSRCQPATCALGILFSVPGTGQEEVECARLSRYWTMLTRAAYALQRTTYDQLTQHFSRLANQGATLSTPSSSRSRCRTAGQRGEPQVFLRGKKYYCALGQYCLATDRVITDATSAFRERLAGAIELPDVVQKPFEQESSILLEELTQVMEQLDSKECKFLFSTLFSYLVQHLREARKEQKSRVGALHKDSLQNRFLIVSDSPLLARRLLYCLARLLFRDHSMHIRTALDYALVWPANGILGMPRKDLIRRRQSNVAKQERINRAWDIPHARMDPSSAYSLPLVSPSVFHRPPSTSSNASSRNSSWKPSWTWFSNGSRSRLADELTMHGPRSDTRTLQTSWASSDFAQARLSGHQSPASPRSTSKSPVRVSSEHSESEEETPRASVVGERPLCTKEADGSVHVALLDTVPISPEFPQTVAPSPMASHAYPLTGFLSRFHPDMLLQAIPHAAYDEADIKAFLAEEELYLAPTISPTSDQWRPTASIVIAEIGHLYRVRKITRSSRTAQVLVPEAAERDGLVKMVRHEERWQDDVLTEVDESLMARVTGVLTSKRPTQALATLIADLAQ
ncbi:hypothetical protein BCR37DRAFT_47218 [Protomyces lactucae-debilis]|uniref:Folliculin-interacting protein N-terminal domain-containing protein n=1 Tax=Protomyces lactucae-debilis TaxID=2754530 RepID=A0A1Y2FDQ4_PROLT|nr:uncharacterized protein BCR37DRAFT_47218 [Protomyces lactucae-debilis]ORY81554.1 hypothetical protein BCR37DRAFT_47218 [Protomyces lactucae-debilis]